MKTAFISGVAGQDGAWLSQLLLQKGYHVIGGTRSLERADSFWRLKLLNIKDRVELMRFDLQNPIDIQNVVKSIKPDEFYNLGAQSSVAESFKNPLETAITDGISVNYLIDSIINYSPATRLFHASSAEIFGNTKDSIQTENTAINPESPYAAAKAYAHWTNKIYRNFSNIFIVNGILYNHESELRSPEFFSRKVTLHAAARFTGYRKVLEVGNIHSERDWGYAKEFTEGMFLSLQKDIPDDYIFASGKKIRLKEFIEYAYLVIGVRLLWEGAGAEEKAYDADSRELIVSINPAFYRPVEIKSFCGNSEKARVQLGWECKTDLKKIAELMVANDIRLFQEKNISYEALK